MLVTSLTLIRFVVSSLKGWLNIYQSEIFDKYLRIYLIFLWKPLVQVFTKSVASDIFRTLSDSRFSKASYADTFRKLEHSRNSTNFYKSVGKNFSELPLIKFFYQMTRLLSCRNFSLRFNEAINVFSLFRAENIRIICSWVIFYVWPDKKIQQHTFGGKSNLQ